MLATGGGEFSSSPGVRGRAASSEKCTDLRAGADKCEYIYLDAVLDEDVCVCVFFPSILDIKFVGRTSRGHTGGRSHRIFNPPSFCGACLDFCREKDSAIPFPRRP